jgi:uncharacterized membrane protein YcjF (UPF0283 family)
MSIPDKSLSRMRVVAVRSQPKLRWWQLSLRTLLALLTLAAVAAFFHKPIGAWTREAWYRWFPAEATPVPTPAPPPPVLVYCPGCGMG